MASITQHQGFGKERIGAGMLGGLAGGIAFGLLMNWMGMLPMVAGLVGSQSALVGFAVHLLISAVIGAGLAVFIGGRNEDPTLAIVFGGIYGLIWWFLGPLLIMPVLMGMAPQFGAALTVPNLMSLIGHLLYGLIAGFTYTLIVGRQGQPIKM